MVAAIAFESVVKLVAFLAVGLYVTFGMFGGFGDLFGQAAKLPEAEALFTLGGTEYGSFLWLTILSMLAIVLLPRQFHMTVVENVDERHLNRAIWMFPLYLLAINLFVLPIALGGLVRFDGTDVSPDTFVLALPMADGAQAIALLGVPRGAVGRDRDGDRGDDRAQHDGVEQPGDAGPGAAASLQRRERARLARARDPPRDDRRGPAARLRLLPRRRGGDRAGVDRPAVLRGRGAVRAGAVRRALLEGGQPLRRACGDARRLRRLGAHAAAAVARPFGLAFRERARARPARHRGAQTRAAFRAHRLRPHLARDVLEHAGERRPLRRRFAVHAPEPGRAGPGGALRRRLPRLGGGPAAVAPERLGRPARGAAGALPRGEAGRRGDRRTTRASAGSRALRPSRPTRNDLPRGDAARRSDRRLVGPGDDRLGGRGGAARARGGHAPARRDLGGDRLQPRARAQVARARGGERRAARSEPAAPRARPHEGRLRLDRDPRAAHAAHVDARLRRDPARQRGAARGRSASASCASSSRRSSGSRG